MRSLLGCCVLVVVLGVGLGYGCYDTTKPAPKCVHIMTCDDPTAPAPLTARKADAGADR